MSSDNLTSDLIFSRSQKNFYGHIISGVWFFFWSLYITINTIKDYWNTREMRQPFTSTLWFSNRNRRQWLADYNICFVAMSIQAIVALAWCFENGHYVVTDIEQYMVLYFGLAMHCLLSSLKRQMSMPFLHVDYFSLIIFNLCGAIVMMGHLEGDGHHNPLESVGHKHGAKALLGLCIVTTLEAANRQSLKLPILRAFLTMVMGTWFFHLAFSLYSPIEGLPIWNPHSHHLKMIVTACFGAYCLFDLGFIFLVCWITTKRFKTENCLYFIQEKEEQEKLLNGVQL